jgi:hypothetical protein
VGSSKIVFVVHDAIIPTPRAGAWLAMESYRERAVTWRLRRLSRKRQRMRLPAAIQRRASSRGGAPMVRAWKSTYPTHNEEITKLSIEGFTFQLTKLENRFSSKP